MRVGGRHTLSTSTHEKRIRVVGVGNGEESKRSIPPTGDETRGAEIVEARNREP